MIIFILILMYHFIAYKMVYIPLKVTIMNYFYLRPEYKAYVLQVRD